MTVMRIELQDQATSCCRHAPAIDYHSTASSRSPSVSTYTLVCSIWLDTMTCSLNTISPFGSNDNQSLSTSLFIYLRLYACLVKNVLLLFVWIILTNSQILIFSSVAWNKCRNHTWNMLPNYLLTWTILTTDIEAA